VSVKGKVTVDSIDDKEDMQFADDAFNILGFTKEEKYNVYKVTLKNILYTVFISKPFIFLYLILIETLN
jgi:myosin heavy subunit